MKILILLLAFFSVSAQADEWRTADTYREVGFQVLNVIDWGQTRYIARHPDQFHERELSWLIGQHPSVIDVDRVMISSAILHPVISRVLLHYNLRYLNTAFQYVTIGSKLNAVVDNHSVGIKVEF